MRPERLGSEIGSRFAIAAPHHAATRAGVSAIRAGGNAVDAALAAAVTLAVVYPHMCGVGGDLFALVRAVDGKTVALNASGAAPSGVDVERVRAAHGSMPVHGPLPVTVPGAVSGWHALWRLGAELPFAASFEAAIAYARDGVEVARSLAGSLAWEPDRLFADPGMRQVFAPQGRPAAEGEVIAQPSLARTLEAIAGEGPSALYGGGVGAALVQGLRAAGSPMTLRDLQGHQPELDSPISARYRDLDVAVVPPNSQGFALLEILGAVEHLGIDPDPLGPDVARLALVFEAVAADRDRHNADPRFARVPIGTLLDDGHLASLADAVREREQVPARPANGDTVALVTADDAGRAVSLIQSLYDGFGSGILEPATGIALHNRGSAFSLDPASPNVLAGGKRPAHTLMPVLVHRRERLAAVAGSMGGGAQPQINHQNLVRTFDLGMAPADALAAPRWLVGGMELHAGRAVDAEARVPAAACEALRRAGFEVTHLGAFDEGAGHAHLILRHEDGRFEAATDPRADGEAAAG